MLVNLFNNLADMTEKEKKPVYKKRWFRVLVVFWLIVLHWIFFPSDNTTTTVKNTPTEQKEVKVDAVQERMDRITELYADDTTFNRVEKLDGSNSIAIIFNETPDLWVSDSIDSITRWQAMNLSKEVNGVASVKTYVWSEAQMYCIATKWQVNECNDYR